MRQNGALCGNGLTLYQTTHLLDWSKLKAFADDKINVTETQKLFLKWVENIAEKGENAGYQHFHLFPQRFQKASFLRLLKVGIVWERIISVYEPLFRHFQQRCAVACI